MTLIPVEPERGQVRPIRENPLVRKQSGGVPGKGLSDAKSGSYMVPEQTCASCGQSTRKSLHESCRRDLSGRLQVKGES